MYTYIYITHIFMYTSICIFAYIYTYIYMCLQIYIFTYIYILNKQNPRLSMIQLCVNMLYIHVYKHMYSYSYIHIRKNTSICVADEYYHFNCVHVYCTNTYLYMCILHSYVCKHKCEYAYILLHIYIYIFFWLWLINKALYSLSASRSLQKDKYNIQTYICVIHTSVRADESESTISIVAGEESTSHSFDGEINLEKYFKEDTWRTQVAFRHSCCILALGRYFMLCTVDARTLD